MNIFWSKALLSTQHSVKLVSYKKGLVLVMVPANFVVEKKFPNMFFVLRCCCCCYCSGENSTKFLTKKFRIRTKTKSFVEPTSYLWRHASEFRWKRRRRRRRRRSDFFGGKYFLIIFKRRRNISSLKFTKLILRKQIYQRWRRYSPAAIFR